jgi:hypothetical protein
LLALIVGYLFNEGRELVDYEGGAVDLAARVGFAVGPLMAGQKLQIARCGFARGFLRFRALVIALANRFEEVALLRVAEFFRRGLSN